MISMSSIFPSSSLFEAEITESQYLDGSYYCLNEPCETPSLDVLCWHSANIL